METWIDTLERLESSYNGGRGISCIRTIIFYLRKGRNSEVLSTVLNEFDKISSYPRLVQIIGENMEGVNYCPKHFQISPQFCTSCHLANLAKRNTI